MDNISSDFEYNKSELIQEINNYNSLKLKYNNMINSSSENVTLNSANFKRPDTSIDNIKYTNVLGSPPTIQITRSNGGSFPRFFFKKNNKKRLFRGIYITFRWAGTKEAYDYNNLNNKKWCLGLGDYNNNCRTSEFNMPPKSGEYVTYYVPITNKSCNNYNLESIYWLTTSRINYDKKFIAVWEFKNINFQFENNHILELENQLINKYNNITELFNRLNQNVNDLLKYDKNIELDENNWNNLAKMGNDLKKEYNNFLINNSDIDYNAQNIDSLKVLNSNSLIYSGIFLLNIIIIFTLFKNLSK